MSRYVRPRFIVVVTAGDGTMSAYGPWYNVEMATKHADQLRAHSAAYTGEPNPDIEFFVQVVTLQRWPGIRAFVRSMSG